MEDMGGLVSLLEQAPSVGAVIVVVVVFLRHLSRVDDLNRAVNRELRDALRELTAELRRDRGGPS